VDTPFQVTHALHYVHHEDNAIHKAHGRCNLVDKVDMAWRVDEMNEVGLAGRRRQNE
jgi:hypothetical protein